ncbi:MULTISPECIES: hypothetical protein [unclassified Modestobacter]
MTTWLVPLLTALVGVLGTVVVTLITQRGQRSRDTDAARRDTQNKTQALLDRYQEPLVRAAYDLQSRLFNIIEQGFLASGRDGVSGPDYKALSTAWLFGQYFGWVEITRREAQFLPIPSRDDEESVQGRIDQVASVCASDKRPLGDAFRVFRSEQRALGELMVVTGRGSTGDERSDCLGYARFVELLADPATPLSQWFSPLVEDVRALGGDATRAPRLLELQRSLIGVVAAIDPHGVRYPKNRDPLPTPSG